MDGSPLLRIDALRLTAGGHAIVDGASFDVGAGEAVGLVGESGCGKSVTALSILGLLPERQISVAGGAIRLEGRDLTRLPDREMRKVRGDRIAMIFQEPMTSLNPVHTVGKQVAEAFRLHGRGRGRALRTLSADILREVGLPAPEAALDRYPHELSGGQRQRVMIAIALACDPDLLVADEPTTALDVTVQAQILDLLDGLRRDRGMGLLLITHDLGVVAQYCDRVLVMYGGRIVEEGAAEALFARPRHRYTEALLRTMPAANAPGAELPAITGSVPAPGARPAGCVFHPRCHATVERCRAEEPPMMGEGHRHRCWNPA